MSGVGCRQFFFFSFLGAFDVFGGRARQDWERKMTVSLGRNRDTDNCVSRHEIIILHVAFSSRVGASHRKSTIEILAPAFFSFSLERGLLNNDGVIWWAYGHDSAAKLV